VVDVDVKTHRRWGTQWRDGTPLLAAGMIVTCVNLHSTPPGERA
jgi:hypothetical protein